MKILNINKWEFISCLSPSDTHKQMIQFSKLNPSAKTEIAVMGNTFGFKYQK